MTENELRERAKRAIDAEKEYLAHERDCDVCKAWPARRSICLIGNDLGAVMDAAQKAYLDARREVDAFGFDKPPLEDQKKASRE